MTGVVVRPKATPLVIAAMAFALAHSAGTSTTPANREVFLGGSWVWPAWWTATGAGCLAAFVWHRRWQWRMVAGSLMIAGCLARAAALAAWSPSHQIGPIAVLVGVAWMVGTSWGWIGLDDPGGAHARRGG